MNGIRSNTSPANVDPDSQRGSPGSVAGRIQASASGLIRQAILRPSASSVTRELASSATDAGKGASGSSSANSTQSLVSSTSSHGQSSSFRDYTDSTGKSCRSESFRPQPRHMENPQHGDQFDFKDFMSQDSGSSLAGNPWGPYRGAGHISDKEKFVLQPHLSSANIQARSAIQSSFFEHSLIKGRALAKNDTDGAAVVALLSGPISLVDEEPTNFSAFDSTFTPEDKSQDLQEYTQAAAPLNQVSAMNPLDLLPNFGRIYDDTNTTGSTNLARAVSNLPKGYLHDEIQLQLHGGDLQPWVDMLNRYQDEVWGDMLPLVQEAREEAKAAKEQIPDDQPATRRLRMLLRHLE